MLEPVTIPAMTREALRKELVAGRTATSDYLRSIDKWLTRLPPFIDDAERDFGLDIYTRMLNDPAVGSALDAIKIAILGDGISIINPLT